MSGSYRGEGGFDRWLKRVVLLLALVVLLVVVGFGGLVLIGIMKGMRTQELSREADQVLLEMKGRRQAIAEKQRGAARQEAPAVPDLESDPEYKKLTDRLKAIDREQAEIRDPKNWYRFW